ncbi:hypothetical protein EVAR_86826_1 [Eumeta japonica]|uniref:Uncharacterized protein n=1 Tax=Eumeta variegata TaxID=151549 RepID=A0A4C1VRU6_EUMVA|nr:hypothetical protein EVAR_86826_1 [Eumeta japonica]
MGYASEKQPEELMNTNETSEQVLALVPPELHKYLTVLPKNNSANATENRSSTKNITEIRKLIQRYNDGQNIYNEDIFGPVQNDTIIIAIQVSENWWYPSPMDTVPRRSHYHVISVSKEKQDILWEGSGPLEVSGRNVTTAEVASQRLYSATAWYLTS